MRGFPTLLSVLFITLFLSHALAATSTSIEIKDGAEELKQTLEAMPYTSIGQGPVLYIFEFSECPYCQALFKEYGGQLPGVEARHFFYAVSQRSANETAALAEHRSKNVYMAFMRNMRKAIPYDANQRRINAFNAVMGPLNEVILPTLRKNGWKSQNMVSPAFVWEEEGKLYADGGYRKDHFETLLASVNPGYQTGKTEVAQKSKPAAARPSPPAGPTRDQIGAPLKSTEVQGIYIGMPVDEAYKVAEEQGYIKGGLYWYQDDGQSRKSLWLGGGNYTKDGKTDPFIKSIKYKRQYKHEIQFPTEGLKNAVLEKYGEPLNEVKADRNFGSYSFRYYPPNPGRGSVEAACSAEMERRGVGPVQMGAAKLHPMLHLVWQERGLREVKAKCPDQLQAYEKLLEFELGIWSTIVINPYTKEFIIDIQNHGPEQYKWRWLKEEKLQRQDSGPKGSVDL